MLKKKRLFHMLLVFVLMLSMFPMSAVQAEEEEGYLFKLAASMDENTINAVYEDDYQNVITGDHINSFPTVTLKSYNREKYRFVGWEINGNVLRDAKKEQMGFTEQELQYLRDTYTYIHDGGCPMTDNYTRDYNAVTCINEISLDPYVDEYRTITPIFEEKTGDEEEFTLTLEQVDGVAASKTWLHDNSYTLRATAQKGYSFKGWKIGDETVSTANIFKVTIEEDTTVTPIVEKMHVEIELLDEYHLTRENFYDFSWSRLSNPLSVWEGQRGALHFSYRLVGEGTIDVRYTINVYEGDTTDGKLLRQILSENQFHSTYDFAAYPDNIASTYIVVDPWPSVPNITLEVIIGDNEPVTKTYDISAQTPDEKHLTYMKTPNAKYSTEDRTDEPGPPILNMFSMVDEETGKLSAYAASYGGVLELKGTEFEFMPGLDLRMGDYYGDTSMSFAVGGDESKLTAFIQDVQENWIYEYSLYEYTKEQGKWVQNKDSIVPGNYIPNNAVIISNDNVWIDNAYWNGEKWTGHEYGFHQFMRSANGHIYAAAQPSWDSDVKRGVYMYKDGEWDFVEGTEDLYVSFQNITPDGTLTYKNGADVYKLTTDGTISQYNNITLDYFKDLWSATVGVDRFDDVYVFEEARVYVDNGTGGARGYDLYKLNKDTQTWTYNEVPEFNGPNEYEVGTQAYIDRKVRPVAVQKIYNINSNASIFAGKAGAAYADFGETTITFNSNGGSDVAPLTNTVNAKIDAPVPTKDDAFFAGWYIDDALTKAYDVAYMPAKNIELFAKWEEKPVDLTAAKAAANDTVEQAYKKYNKRDYDEEDWSALTAMKDEGLAQIADMKGSEDDVKAAANKVVASMQTIPVSEYVTVAVSMEKFTLGQGYIIEPTLVKIRRNTQASYVITNLLVDKYGENPLPYKMTGKLNANFYLAHVRDEGNQAPYNIPAYILKAIAEDGSEFTLENDEWLGEFDFFKNSGWMYAINNAFPGVGAAGWTLENDQVMRWQYTIYGLGADLNANNGAWGTEAIVKTAQKDNLTWRVAEINSLSAEDKAAFLAVDDNEKHYNNAYAVLTNMESTQAEVDAALKALGGVSRTSDTVEVTMPEEAKVMNEAIQALPAAVKLADADVIQAVRANYDALDLAIKQWIWVDEVHALEAAEAKLAKLKEQVTNVQAQIDALPAIDVLQVTDEQLVKEAQQAYALLTEEQQQAVDRAQKLEAVVAQLTALQQAADEKVDETTKPEDKPEQPEETTKPDDKPEQPKQPEHTTKPNVPSVPATPAQPSIPVTPPTEIPSAPKEPTTNVWAEAVTASTNVEKVEATEQHVTVTATNDTVTLDETLIEQLQQRAVTVSLQNDVSIDVPASIVASIAQNAALQVAVVQNDDRISVQLHEVRDGQPQALTFNEAYVTVQLPLQTEAARAVVQLAENGYKAVPHTMKDSIATIYINENAQFTYVTQTKTFDDINEISAQEDIEYLATRYVVNGTTDATFAPTAAITRAQFGAMIARALNLHATEQSVYADTKGKWYEDNIQALYEAGITHAVSDFNPNAPLTREHAAAFMFRTLQYIDADVATTSTLTYTDQDDVQRQFVEAVSTLNTLHIMEGKEGNRFDAKEALTRAQMAKILRRTLAHVNMM